MDDNFSANTFGDQPLISYAPPSGFSAAHDGIYVETVDKDGEVGLEWLCSPLAVVASGRNVQHASWSRCIEFVDPEGVVQRRYVLEKDLAVGFNKVLGDLCDQGLKIARTTAARRQLNTLIADWVPAGRYQTTDRLGWADATCKAFVLGDKHVVGKANTVFLNPVAPVGAPAMTRRGALDQWRAEVAGRCVGNPILVASMSLAFAGPLPELLEKDSFGVHLRGGSSSGKSTAMLAALSVWGSPSLMQSWRATANALEGVAATCNGSLLALDELALVSGSEAGDAIYTLANGQGKSRLSSSARLQPKNKWRLTVLSTGEISLADKMEEARKKTMTGQEVRLIDISADTRRYRAFDTLHGSPDSSVFAEEIKQAAERSYGTAGPQFIERLIGNEDLRIGVKGLIARTVSHWKRALEIESSGPTSRVLGHFATMAWAGELATNFGITGWQKREALNAHFELAKEWCNAQDRSEQWQINTATERTRAFLRLHGDSRFQEARSAPVANKAGYRDDKWFFILRDAWNEIHVGHALTDQAKHLFTGGWMVRGDGKNLLSKTPGWVSGRPRAYKVRAEILNAAVGASVPVNAP